MPMGTSTSLTKMVAAMSPRSKYRLFLNRGTDLAHWKHIRVAGNLNYGIAEILKYPEGRRPEGASFI